MRTQAGTFNRFSGFFWGLSLGLTLLTINLVSVTHACPPNCGPCMHWEGPINTGECVLNSGASCGTIVGGPVCDGECEYCNTTSCSCQSDTEMCDLCEECQEGSCIGACTHCDEVCIPLGGDDWTCSVPCSGECESCDSGTNECVDDNDLCTVSNCERCVSGICQSRCENGDCCGGNDDCVEPDDYSPSGTNHELDLNPALVGIIESAVNQIPNVNVDIEKVGLEITSMVRDCCDAAGMVVSNGDNYTERKLKLQADIQDVQIYGFNLYGVEVDLGFLIVTIDAEVGINLNCDFVVYGMSGYRTNECKPEECPYWGGGGDVELSLFIGVESIVCIETYVTEKGCTDLVIGGSGKIEFGGEVSYNGSSCSSGMDGSFGLQEISYQIEFSVDGFGFIYGPHMLYP